ncbi:MAG: YhdP family protein [Pseudomonadota bacterium]
MNEPPPLPSRPLKAYAAVAKGALWLLLSLWLLLALAWGALHAWIVPRIGEFRPVLERQAQRALGVPVRIGSISARSEGLIPSFELREVVLLDAQGRAALRLPRVLAALSPRSLWNLGFEQLYIEGPQLDIRRAKDGRISVAGLDFSRSSDNDGRAADWFFRQGEFAIRGGTVQWTDEMRGAPTLALERVDFVVRNRARRHALRLDATPPTEWGERFSLAGQFRQPLLSGADGQWREWTGELHADFARIDLSQLRRYADLGVRIGQGQGSVRAWADVDRGRFTGGTADVALYEAEATLGASLQPLALRQLSGRLGGKRFAGGFTFETQALQFETRDGLRWPGGNVSLSWTEAHGQKPAAGELRADKLDLAALGQIATRLPLGTATHAALSAYAPQGLVETLQAKWEGPIGALQKYEARGKASRLALAAQSAPPVAGATHPPAGIPGLRGAAIDFDFTQSGGKARLAVQQGALEFPGVFDDPVLPMDSLSGDLQWQIDGPKIAVSLANLKFSNVDAQGQGQVSWRTADVAKAPGRSRFPGVLELQASLSRADGTRVWRYLPLGVPASARAYVHESVQRGVATAAKFRVKGDLRDFPFKDGKSGEFLITADIKDATYAYVPRSTQRGTVSWPALTQLSGELVFQGNGMQVKNAAGSFAGAPGLQVKADASIPDFHTTTVGVTGLIRGPLAESLAIVNGSPVAGFTGNALAKARGSGAADVRLRLVLPMHQIDRSQVQGTVTLSGNDLQITPDSPLLARAKGAVTFSERGFTLVGTQARALGGDVRIEGGMRPAAQPGGEPVTQIRAGGTATAEALRQARELGFVARLARDFSGGASYAMALNFRHGTPELLVTSNLQGMGVNLPPPLKKAPEAVLPLRYETVASRDPAGRLQDQLTVDVGRLASIVFQRDLSAEEARVLRGSIAIGLAPGESAPLPDQGVAANVQLAQLNIDAWESVLDRLGAEAPRAGANGRAGGTSAASSMGYLPTTMAARAKELVVEGRTLHDVVIGGSRDGLTWRANVDAQELNGYLEYRQPSGTEQGRVHARLARLNIAAAAAREVETLLDQQPANIPALDVVVNDFELKGKKLGRLEIDAVNRGARDGGVREWRLNKLALTTPEALFNAQGNWAAVSAQGPAAPARSGPEQRRTAMRFQLDIADAGGLLGRFGMPGVVRRGQGRMEGQIAWLGSPLSMDYPSMTGGFRVNVESGQFLKADPGLAKLLGVLSLQSLPRRLALDFRDLFSEGFPFDFVRGDIGIDRGIASTNNLQMKGVNAAVLMEGKADIARETQDLKVVVVPEINAGTASLVATMINPAIGLGSFLAQMFLRQPLMRAATQEFHIDGTWSDPKVARVGRGAAATPPAAAGAAPSPTADNR